jgi:hypothetical protein
MHAPHKACNFRFTKSKGREEKLKQKRVKGRKRDMQRRCKEGGAGGWLMAKYDFRVRKYCIYTYSFFISVGWLNRFGSVQSVSDFRNRNRTEPEFFYDFFNRLIQFFFGSVFSVIFFPVFSVYRFFCSPLLCRHAEESTNHLFAQ